MVRSVIGRTVSSSAPDIPVKGAKPSGANITKRSMVLALLKTGVLVWSMNAPLEAVDTSVLKTSRELPSPAARNLILKKVFHIAGIRKIPRNARGNLVLTDRDLTFLQGKKVRFLLPFDRIRHVQFLSGERNYEKATYGAAVATLGVGALLILKKHRVETLVFDFVNERGGLMGMVIQTELEGGLACKDWLTRFGVTAKEPPPETRANAPKE